ncbi:MAG TPA: glycosyltransferase family 4 protein [Ktedonobacteraceae bacterium]|jgi:glycosyltransferase involved in cell wall biosynthesis|nr:glycosyltransferase family 4 protein [Ktedonobacteraceae bacterium]
MRIMMLTQFYPPIIGGGAIHVRSLSTELATRGHEVAVVTLWHAGLAAFEMDAGVKVYRVRSSTRRLPWLFRDSGRQYAPPFPDPEVTLALRQIIRDERPQIVHAHNWLVYSYLPLKLWSGAKLVVTLHNYDLVCVKTTLLLNDAICNGPGLTKCLRCGIHYYGPGKGVPTVLADRVMGQIRRSLVDMFLPVSQAVALGNSLAAQRLPFQVISNFIPDDVGRARSDTPSYATQLPKEPYLLFVGAFNRQKGVDILLKAYSGLSGAPPLVLIGYETSDWPVLNKDSPANVFVFKDWPRHAVMEALRRCMLVLLPSVGPESCPTVVMEAMATGSPVIASHIGGLAELVTHGETGLLVEPGNIIALQDAIIHLLADSDSRKRMGEAALRYVSKFQASTVVPRIEQVYEALLQKVTAPAAGD